MKRLTKEAEEKLGKFGKESDILQGFFLSVLKQNLDDIEKNISFLQEVYDEVRGRPYEDDAIDAVRCPGGLLEGYICQFDDLEYEEPEKRQKEFLRIAVSVVAMLPHDYQEVKEHVSRRILEVEKLLAQPLPAHEAED